MGKRGREGEEGRHAEARDRPTHFLVTSAAYETR